MEEMYIAHIRDTDGAIQTIREHSEAVAGIGAGFALKPYKDVVYNAGLLHDVGKYQDAFQKKIRGLNIRVDHSTCGAIAAKENVKDPAGLILEYIIAGHHGGIPNGGTKSDMPGEGKDGASLRARLKKFGELEDFSEYQKDGIPQALASIDSRELAAEIAKDCRTPEQLIDKYAFIVRMCYSALVDADSLDTEHFCSQITRHTLQSNYSGCIADIERKFNGFVNKTALQKARSILQKQAYENISKPGEIYMMNMPTGSGKTLCGTKCALMKAIQERKKRIIYVIPYNSIITQTADELEKTFGSDARILRHQSTYAAEDDENLSDELKIRVQQATENWDADIIVTTMVQFFETVFSNKRGKLRKMHNMADSVLIFDEAHLMPLKFLQPCLENIVYLTRYGNCSAIFLTATMPDYEQLLRTYTFPDVKVVDLVPDKTAFRYFSKCVFKDEGRISADSLPALCGNDRSTLIVVNSREKAKAIYTLFSDISGIDAIHLSTYMTKADIKAGIARIKTILSENTDSDRRLVVVSTSLIEAGIDLDFETVFREYAGLDSILQAGGRCNREGKREFGVVHMFELEGQSQKETIRAAVTRSLIKEFRSESSEDSANGNTGEYSDISNPDCVRDFFSRVFMAQKEEITENAMHNFCTSIDNVPFADYDGMIIKSMEQSVVVPESEEARLLVRQLQYGAISGKMVRLLQKYTCSLPPAMFEELLEAGVVNDFGTGVYVLQNMDYYSAETGIGTEGRDYFL